MNDGKFDSRPELIALVDEVHRLAGRLKSVFAEARRTVDLGDSEMLALNAVVEADRPPTVSQIGRSLGVARQIVQRAANALVDAGLIETRPNPDHKRAPLLVPTEAGVAMKRQADRSADAIAQALSQDIDLAGACELTRGLRAFRRQIEAQLRQGAVTAGDSD
ncbi:MarR family winged helix-turn-helix transcriptional regulator [Novosphingobium sp. TH158]|uniref:MarR family winged helix-turn-helix transcriptional regulator n=1 Tax=Novosphingobium sp. TH158 TaxID=2067455 RepID=UPI000C7CCE06|nr:MarR family transcriptional regulator [Novosphingobium sp. TH158]PLK26299.1 MarR family transcriptional regulator [Novosphingobium sp. TH158]